MPRFRRNRPKLVLWVLWEGVFLVWPGVSGQPQSWSELQFRYELWQAALRVRQRSEQLQAQGLIPISELERARAETLAAEMNFRILLERWCYNPPLRMADAVLTPLPTGGWQLRLTWINEAPNPAAGKVAELLWEQCQAADVRAIVQVTDESGRSVGMPPEQALPLWAGSREKTLTFTMVHPRRVVYVMRRTLTQERRDGILVRLQGSLHRVEALTPSQVGTLGDVVRYPLAVQGLASDTGPCVLGVEGLPDEVSAQFYDPQTDAVVRAVETTSDTMTRSVELRLTLSDTWNPGALDRPVRFRVGCRHGTDLEPAVPLELTPTGRPVLDVVAENYFGQARVGEILDFHLVLRNRGYRAAPGVRLEVEGPPRWSWEWSPPVPWTVSPREQVPVTLRLRIPEDGTPGEYTLRLRWAVPITWLGESRSGLELRVRLLGRSGVGPWLVMAGVILGLIGVTLMIGRLMRRY